MLRGPRSRYAPSDEIRPWSTDSILNDVREERREYQADEQAEDRDMRLVDPRLEHESPEQEKQEGRDASVDDVPEGWDALDLCKGELERDVVEGEHTVEGLGDHLKEDVAGQ